MDDGATRPRQGAVRINDDGQVEVFDGEAWHGYERLPSSGPEPLIREDPPPSGLE